jgi:hypothetical protein
MIMAKPTKQEQAKEQEMKRAEATRLLYAIRCNIDGKEIGPIQSTSVWDAMQAIAGRSLTTLPVGVTVVAVFERSNDTIVLKFAVDGSVSPQSSSDGYIDYYLKSLQQFDCAAALAEARGVLRAMKSNEELKTKIADLENKLQRAQQDQWTASMRYFR